MTCSAAVPVPTLITLAVLAAIVWLNAAINPFRFNVMLGVLATVPALWVLVRAAGKARRASVEALGPAE